MNTYKINNSGNGAKKYIKVEIASYRFDGKKTNRLSKIRSVRFESGSLDKIYARINELV